MVIDTIATVERRVLELWGDESIYRTAWKQALRSEYNGLENYG